MIKKIFPILYLLAYVMLIFNSLSLDETLIPKYWSSGILFSPVVLFLSEKLFKSRDTKYLHYKGQVSQVILTSVHYLRETLRHITVFKSVTNYKTRVIKYLKSTFIFLNM